MYANVTGYLPKNMIQFFRIFYDRIKRLLSTPPEKAKKLLLSTPL